MVCTPEEAIDCFQRTRMHMLAIGPFLAVKPRRRRRRMERVHDSSAPQSRELYPLVDE